MKLKKIVSASIGSLLCFSSLAFAVNNSPSEMIQITVNFPGMSSVHTSAYVADGIADTISGDKIKSMNWKNDQAILEVPTGIYDLKLTKGDATHIVDNVDCSAGNCSVDNLVAEMEVNFPGMSSVHTDARLPDGVDGSAEGGQVTKNNWKTDQAILKVFPQLYDVRLRKDQATHIIDNVDCRSGSCSINNLVAEMVVNFPGMSSVHTDARIPDNVDGSAEGGKITAANWKKDQAILKVFPQIYDVRLRKDQATHIIDNIDCTSGSCTLNNLVADMVVNFPGMSSVHTDARLPDGVVGSAEGGQVTASNWKKDQAILKVFPQIYDVRLRKDQSTHIIDSVDCTSGSCSVDNLVAYMTINFPGMSSVHSDARVPDGIDGTADGGEVSAENWKKETATLKLFPQVYDVRIRKDKSILIVDNVDCSTGSCTVDDITAMLTVRFPGLSSMHSSVHLPDAQDNVASGEEVGKANWKNNQAEIVVLRQMYDVSVIKQGATDATIYDNVDCSSANCDVLFEGNAQIVLIDGDTNTPIANQLLWIYEKFADGNLNLYQKGTTYTQGNANFSLPGLGAGRTYVAKISNPYGNKKKYYSPFITATGPFQFIVSRDGENTLDLIPPEITIASPQNNGNVRAKGFQISGTAEDNREVSNVSITIVQASNTINLDAQYDTVSKQWTATIETTLLEENTLAEVTVLAIDSAGNQSSSQIVVTPIEDNSGPIITISSHQDNAEVPVTGFLLSGTVSDLTGVNSLTASLIDPILGSSINNAALSFSSQSGNWTLAVQNGQISVNEVIGITLDASDIDGNSSTIAINLSVTSVDNSGAHILNRITFGATPLLLQELQNIGAQAYLEQQLNPRLIDDSDLDSRLAILNPGANPSTKEELKSWTLMHMIYSKRQLLEVMTWFWDNHFNTDIDVKRNNADNVTLSNTVNYELQENIAFRNNALGRFRDLLAISTKSPAMLIYLDSISNVAGDSNENYAREVLELHTMGVDGGYTHQDIEAGAEIFTGWHLRNNNFFFDNSRHNAMSHTVLGTNVPAAGEVQGEIFLDIIAAHPATANYICSKLVRVFISDTAINSITSRCASTFLNNLTASDQIAQVLTVILTSPEFFSPENYRAKIKTPLEFVVGAIRNLEIDTNAEDFADAINRMGINLYENPVPTGWSEVGEDWINSSLLIERIKWVNQLTRSTAQNGPDLLNLFPAYGYETAEGIVGFLLSLSVADDYTELSRQQALDLLNGTGQFDLNNVDARERLNQFGGAVLSYPQYQFQ